jgi:hypothetical protein
MKHLEEVKMNAATLHDLAVIRCIVGVECDHCDCRTLLTAETVRAEVGDMRTLEEAGVRCLKCRSRKLTVTPIHSRSAAHAFMTTI